MGGWVDMRVRGSTAVDGLRDRVRCIVAVCVCTSMSRVLGDDGRTVSGRAGAAASTTASSVAARIAAPTERVAAPRVSSVGRVLGRASGLLRAPVIRSCDTLQKSDTRFERHRFI